MVEYSRRERPHHMRRSVAQLSHPISLLNVVNEIDDGAMPTGPNEPPCFERLDLTTQFEVDENNIRPETEALLKRSQFGRQDIVDGVSERLQ